MNKTIEIKVKYQRLAKSEITNEIILERIESVMRRFEDLAQSKIVVLVSMNNSPSQTGEDNFTAKFTATGGKYSGIVMQKSGTNLYAALASLIDHLQERLNRHNDKVRVKNIKKERKVANFIFG